jgi:4a-hydroxytetrahydrobiopterin dehydratase
MTTDLLALHCSPQRGVAMNAAEIAQRLGDVDGWQAAAGAIEKTFAFANYHETMAFVNALAWIAHREDHHPELRVGYDRCIVRWNTHSVGGVSINDFICAARCDALVARAG